jgi:site-specific recombinase XerC
VLITTRQFFRWCTRAHLVKVDPELDLKLPPEPEVEPKPISAATFANLVKTATTMGEFWEQARNVALLYCLRDTGGRIGGLLNARLDDLELKAGLLTVCEKGNRLHDLPLNEPVRAALRQWLKVRATFDPETDHLFIGLHGQPLTRSTVHSILGRLKAACAFGAASIPIHFGTPLHAMLCATGATLARFHNCWGISRPAPR